jgi:hypothetical protein
VISSQETEIFKSQLRLRKQMHMKQLKEDAAMGNARIGELHNKCRLMAHLKYKLEEKLKLVPLSTSVLK